MRKWLCIRVLIVCALLTTSNLPAMANDSAYTKLNLEKDCSFHSEYEAGGSAVCNGYKGYPVHFSEGDLRQMVRFGHIANLEGQWESFGQFNQVNETIEWRLRNGIPFAAILRWFIENSGPDGVPAKKYLGQVLVVSKVATPGDPHSCVVGYVDARANKNANVLARNVADQVTDDFVCGRDTPKYRGSVGKYAGEPNRFFD